MGGLRALAGRSLRVKETTPGRRRVTDSSKSLRCSYQLTGQVRFARSEIHPDDSDFLLCFFFRLASTANTAASRWWTCESACSISPSTATSSSALTAATWTTTSSNPSPPTKFSRLIDECCLRTLATPPFVSALFLTRHRQGFNLFSFLKVLLSSSSSVGFPLLVCFYISRECDPR